jgi:hypothetical protein
MFAPVVVVHPLRVARLRLMTITLTGFWTATTIAAVVHGLPEAGVLPKAVLIAGALYYIVLPLFRRLSRTACAWRYRSRIPWRSSRLADRALPRTRCSAMNHKRFRRFKPCRKRACPRMARIVGNLKFFRCLTFCGPPIDTWLSFFQVSYPIIRLTFSSCAAVGHVT